MRAIDTAAEAVGLPSLTFLCNWERRVCQPPNCFGKSQPLVFDLFFCNGAGFLRRPCNCRPSRARTTQSTFLYIHFTAIHTYVLRVYTVVFLLYFLSFRCICSLKKLISRKKKEKKKLQFGANYDIHERGVAATTLR